MDNLNLFQHRIISEAEQIGRPLPFLLNPQPRLIWMSFDLDFERSNSPFLYIGEATPMTDEWEEGGYF